MEHEGWRPAGIEGNVRGWLEAGNHAHPRRLLGAPNRPPRYGKEFAKFRGWT